MARCIVYVCAGGDQRGNLLKKVKLRKQPGGIK
jgi:hypothetical protein